MIRDSTLAWKRRGHPHAQIHLPPLTADQALLLANLLDRAIAALWRTHGDAMADRLACIDPDSAITAQSPDDVIVTSADDCADDDPF